jgi:6-phosphogluconolactonase (cycloisomerase 2 family)
VAFSPNGRHLVVTEKASNLIDVFNVDKHGVAGPATATPSTGETPFGFAFTGRNVLLVANAAGGAPGLSSASSYVVNGSGAADFVAGDIATGQTAACWTVVSSNGRYVYTTNTGSGTISGYRVGRDGSLTALNADGVTATTGAGSRPADASVAGDFLYTRSGGTLTITIDHIERDGSLTPVGTVTGLPDTAVGLVAA